MGRSVTERLLLKFAPPAAAGVIRLLSGSLRIDWLGLENLQDFWDKKSNVILAFWHDQLLLMAQGYRGPGARILISPSTDGELIARTMACFGHQAIRGSSSRDGSKALMGLVRMAREPFDLVITPDGPKGPRHEVKGGVAQLARLTGRPVIPMTFCCSRGHRFASWDRFLLPYPFGRGVFSFGDAVVYESGEDMELFRQRIQTAMDENLRRAQAHLEGCGVSAV